MGRKYILRKEVFLQPHANNQHVSRFFRLPCKRSFTKQEYQFLTQHTFRFISLSMSSRPARCAPRVSNCLCIAEHSILVRLSGYRNREKLISVQFKQVNEILCLALHYMFRITEGEMMLCIPTYIFFSYIFFPCINNVPSQASLCFNSVFG